jgi:hypothetical protein
MTDGEVEKNVRQATDRLLLEQGVYIPLELLLAEGRLLYADYEAWRTGERGYLDACLFGDPEQSRAFLEQGAAYAADLGLKAEYFTYSRWGGGSDSEKLRFSPDSIFDRLFHTGYRKPIDAPQLDLFMDATGVTLVNGVTGALKERNYAEARRLLERLFDVDPGNGQLGDLELLVGATESLHLPVEDASADLDHLEQELAPLAGDKLGPGCRDFLAPFWQRLLKALQDEPFDPDHPKLHASYPAIQLEDWNLVKRSIASGRDWNREPLLLRRFARACGRLQQNELAVSCWFRLCWHFPNQADAIGREAESIWRSRWQRFMGLEPELDSKDFPAWSLLEQPGFVPRPVDKACMTCKEAPEDYLVTADLVMAGAAAIPAVDLIEQRRRLKDLNPNLFTHYLDRFGRQ